LADGEGEPVVLTGNGGFLMFMGVFLHSANNSFVERSISAGSIINQHSQEDDFLR
jgi:hypothetical protein